MGTYSQLLQKNDKAPATEKPEQVIFPEPKPNRPQEDGDIASKQTSNIVSNIAILQFGEEDFAFLREAAYKAQTFRLSEQEVGWLKDTAYQLSKEMKRGKATQVNILRLSMRLFNNLLASDKNGVIKILEQMT